MLQSALGGAAPVVGAYSEPEDTTFAPALYRSATEYFETFGATLSTSKPFATKQLATSDASARFSFHNLPSESMLTSSVGLMDPFRATT